MKTISRKRSKAVLAIAFAAGVAAMMFACDEGTDLPMENDSGPISLDEIIASPKSPTPGDTVTLTAVINSSSQNTGDFPSIGWTASGGAFLEDNLQTVHWVAPRDTMNPASVTGMYTISCDVANDVTPKRSLSIEVFVSDPMLVLDRNAGQIYLMANETDFYYQRTSNVSQGAEIWKVVGGVNSDAVPGGTRNGRAFQLSEDQSHATYFEIGSSAGRVDPPVEVFIDDLGAGTFTKITQNRKLFFEIRHDQYLYPKFSPDNNLVTFHQMWPAPFVGGVDTFDIDVYDVNTQVMTNVTKTHGMLRRNNFHASFSPAQDWLVFVSDRGGQNRWELYGLPVTGDQVATDSSATVQLSVTGGNIMAGAQPQELYQAPPFYAWNGDPASNVLAWMDGDQILWLFALNSSGATQTEVVGLAATPRFMAWSGDGQQLAIATATELYICDLSGSATRMLTKPLGDSPRDVAWSRDGNWLLYRVSRSSFTWHELLDVNLGPDQVPAVITPSSSSTDLNTYAGRMSIASLMNSADVVTVLVWPAGQSTPGVTRLDVTGITRP